VKTAYFDCPSGISGDMVIGAFLDAGLPLERLRDGLAKLRLAGYRLEARRVKKHGIEGTMFTVEAEEGHLHRSFADIEGIIRESGLGDTVREASIGIFTKLAEAESRIHGVPAREVRFHEIGAIDSIIDIVGCAVAMDVLGIDEVCASAVPLGSGFVKTLHGLLPVPAPATLELLKGVPVYSGGIERELTTPTGAAILAYYSRGYGEVPAMTVRDVGYGAGSADLEVPNLLRVMIGERDGALIRDRVAVLETNIDDMNPEFCEYLAERLFAAGALDVGAIPMMMKKFRPAVMLRVVSPPEKLREMADIVLGESTTAGVRYHYFDRLTLPRETIDVETPYGQVRVKLLRGNGALTVSPEYEDCRRAAASSGAPLKDVYDAAREGARRKP
jgi:pyridinium-3,5-bisthiocarboxylic acid mononucleotide nickel chelatase